MKKQILNYKMNNLYKKNRLKNKKYKNKIKINNKWIPVIK